MNNRGRGPKGGDPHASLPNGVRPLRTSLNEMSTRLGLAAPDTLNLLFTGWLELVGEPLASHVVPTGLRDGVLRLRADESAWAAQVGYLGTELVDRINERVGAGVVRELAVSVRGSRTPRGGAGFGRARP
jgi:predicted nucleic acid-binding Zn ribbon protein